MITHTDHFLEWCGTMSSFLFHAYADTCVYTASISSCGVCSLRERWLGLPMSSSAGVRGVLGARPLLSHVRAVSGAWLAPSPDRLPVRALSCRLLQRTQTKQSASVQDCTRCNAAL